MFSRPAGICFGFVVICLLFTVAVTQNWRGNIESYKRWERTTCRRCLCQYSWGCSLWRIYGCDALKDRQRCQSGWRHNGDYNCRIPICRPNCGPVGECTAPQVCDCKDQAIGQFCQQLTCSYARPCYPGNCYNNDRCNCTAGFVKESSSEYGCMKIDSNNIPHIGKSTTTIRHIRKTDNKFLFYFELDGTDDNIEKRIVWSNQRIFNEMDFRFETSYEQPEALTERPGYVHSTEVGIVEGSVSLRVLDYSGVVHPTQQYDTECTGISQQNPKQLFNCTITEQEFKTLIEHADTLKVEFRATNGGFRRINRLGNLQPNEYFQGQTATKSVLFKFDFQAPKHCSEDDVEGYTLKLCPTNSTMLNVGPEFTKKPITVYWKGWTDDEHGSQMWMYYLELHKLVVEDATLQLTERNPIGPMAKIQMLHLGNGAHEQKFTPEEPGIYSILMEVRDIANNSRITRRFVLYDDVSDVEIGDSENGLHVASAHNHTGNMWWQSQGQAGQETNIVVNWTDHFINRRHETGYYNNEIKVFKPQFENLEDDGILFAKKFVDPKLDDNEGKRTRAEIPNKRGIVQFDYQLTRNIDDREPGDNWMKVNPIQTSITLQEIMDNGDQLKVWVRALDVLGNTKLDSTMVTTDFTPPITSNADDKNATYMVLNSGGDQFNYTSSLHLEASDTESGVRELGLEISIHLEGLPDNDNNKVFKTVKANTDDTRNPATYEKCVQSKDKTTCFIKDQTVYLDNCWLTVPNQAYLSVASATIKVIAYNQAMLTSNVTFEIPAITELTGLEPYTGPETARIENVQPGSFRLAWEFPKKMSCYASQTTIIIVLFRKNADKTVTIGTYVVPGSSTYFDIASLDPDTEYELTFTSKIGENENDPLALKARTASQPQAEGVSIGAIIGIVGGVLAIVAIILILFVILVRRGYIHPQERVSRVKRSVTRKYRQTVYGDAETGTGHAMTNPAYSTETSGKTYDNRVTMSEHDELYLYGGMDINMPEVEHIDRADITFEGIIKEGHFARIYKASLRNSRAQTTVVAKTLKEKFTSEDEMLMRAKINFTGTVVGEHPNVLKFLGAVVGDDAMGPFIVYEYCENGTLKDYLTSKKSHVTIELQEHLFRFGLDVAKGMEYLASKRIVHRRLAARNILLTFLNEIKISGFGPQPDVQGDGDGEKQERIPIKWMAPECMTSTKDATERSDVWSYAVVLWEIFTLGETPYTKMKSRQLPVALRKGERLPKPKQCDDTWYGVMKRCWEYDPSNRPVFEEVRSELDEMFVASPGDDYYYYKR